MSNRGGDYNKQSLDSLPFDRDYRDKRLKQITQTDRLPRLDILLSLDY